MEKVRLDLETKKMLLSEIVKEEKKNIDKETLNKMFILKKLMGLNPLKYRHNLIFYNEKDKYLKLPISKDYLNDCEIDHIYVSIVSPQFEVSKAKKIDRYDEELRKKGKISDYIKLDRRNFILEFLNPEKELGIIYLQIFHPSVVYLKYLVVPEQFRLTDEDYKFFKKEMEKEGIIERNYIDVKGYQIMAKEIRKNGKFIKGYIYSTLYVTENPEYTPQFFIRADKILSVDFYRKKENCCGEIYDYEEIRIVYEKSGERKELVANRKFYYSVATGTVVHSPNIVGVYIYFEDEKKFYEAIEWHRKNVY